MVRRSCSQTTSVICSCAHKQWIYCSIVYACQNKVQGTKITIIFIIKEDSLYSHVSTMNQRITMKTKLSLFPWELKKGKK